MAPRALKSNAATCAHRVWSPRRIPRIAVLVVRHPASRCVAQHFYAPRGLLSSTSLIHRDWRPYVCCDCARPQPAHCINVQVKGTWLRLQGRCDRHVTTQPFGVVLSAQSRSVPVSKLSAVRGQCVLRRARCMSTLYSSTSATFASTIACCDFRERSAHLSAKACLSGRAPRASGWLRVPYRHSETTRG